MKNSTGTFVLLCALLCSACGSGGGSSSSVSDNFSSTTKDTSKASGTVGSGTPESCTAAAFISAVKNGGTIKFNCGSAPHTITLTEPAKIYNKNNENVIIDGGGLITLSGGGTTRILYMNTCDQSLTWLTSHCDNQPYPTLTVQNLSFINGNSSSETEHDGGGAIWVRGGRFKVFNSTFTGNTCATTGPDVGGGAIRVFDQYNDLPVYITGSTFSNNSGANGGALSSIGVSWTIRDSLFDGNNATGNGGNPADSGTPGGGSGGAIYNDGNSMTLALYNSTIRNSKVNAHGAAIFFVSNTKNGKVHIENSTLSNNTGGSSWIVKPGISMDSGSTLEIVNSTIQ